MGSYSRYQAALDPGCNPQHVRQWNDEGLQPIGPMAMRIMADLTVGAIEQWVAKAEISTGEAREAALKAAKEIAETAELDLAEPIGRLKAA